MIKWQDRTVWYRKNEAEFDLCCGACVNASRTLNASCRAWTITYDPGTGAATCNLVSTTATGKMVIVICVLSVSLTQKASPFQGGVQSVSGSPLLAPDNDTLLFYFGGQQGFSVSCVGPGSQTGLATLRRDGYAAMETNSSHAGVLTSE